ncbi:hypothetical protein STXM2123_5095 [Streptomyces sp. F-3]|nr:hypothetical protein STXM2123_5095 [Streptomyces sp. F-3]
MWSCPHVVVSLCGRRVDEGGRRDDGAVFPKGPAPFSGR